MIKKKHIQIVGWALLILAFISGGVILITDHAIQEATNQCIFSDTASIPRNKAGLLLGTSKTLRSGLPNRYFQYRIDAASMLFKSGKIASIVISGDNSRENYNEPQDMKAELIKQGIPEGCIYLDYAGFRTLDSVVRMNKIFGQNSFTIISQEFHNQRAIYIAKANGLKAVGFNAKDVDTYNGFKTKTREKLARMKLFLDLWTGKEPKFLGEPININSK